jgi:hypothetical protein
VTVPRALAWAWSGSAVAQGNSMNQSLVALLMDGGHAVGFSRGRVGL